VTWIFQPNPSNPTAWNATPTIGDWPDQPSADFDLMVRDPNDVVVAQSTSFDNTYEVIDFRPLTTGSHTLTIKARRCDAATPVAWALWRR
jgi:hypothetical protein